MIHLKKTNTCDTPTAMNMKVRKRVLQYDANSAVYRRRVYIRQNFTKSKVWEGAVKGVGYHHVNEFHCEDGEGYPGLPPLPQSHFVDKVLDFNNTFTASYEKNAA